jgi:hypothetical protein
MRDVWYLVTNPDESLCLAKGQEDIETVVNIIPRPHVRYFYDNAWQCVKLMAIIHFFTMFMFLSDIVQAINFVLSVMVVCTDNGKYTLPYVCAHIMFNGVLIPMSVLYNYIYSACISTMYTLVYCILLIFYMRVE